MASRVNHVNNLLRPNKFGNNLMQMDTQALRQLCVQRRALPHEFFMDVMLGKMKCRTCKGAGLKRYRLSEKRQAKCTCENPAHCWRCVGTGVQIWNERVCQSCRGDGDEVVSPETSLNAAKELAQYVATKLKQVDHTSSDGSQRPQWKLVVVRPGEPTHETIIDAPSERKM